MKTTIALIMSMSSTCLFAAERGINYDPAHDPNFTSAQQRNDLNGMKRVVQQDLRAIQNAGFTTLKTFYSTFGTVDGNQLFTPAEIACPMNLNIALGVYEFNPATDNCGTWCTVATKKEVAKAIESANKYPDCVKMIIVGNEDIYNWNFTQPNKEIQQRIAADISTIKKGVNNKNIIITSAQQDGAWLQLSKNDPYGILPQIQHIGANIYPFWSAQKPNVENGKGEFNHRLEAMKTTFPDKTIIVTEEGWPSSGSAGQNPNAKLEQEKEYYTWWQSRASQDTFDSFYFAMFDKQPSNSDADKYFGLCTYQNESKIIDNCQ